jgi:hypothetical protein
VHTWKKFICLSVYLSNKICHTYLPCIVIFNNVFNLFKDSWTDGSEIHYVSSAALRCLINACKRMLFIFWRTKLIVRCFRNFFTDVGKGQRDWAQYDKVEKGKKKEEKLHRHIKVSPFRQINLVFWTFLLSYSVNKINTENTAYSCFRPLYDMVTYLAFTTLRRFTYLQIYSCTQVLFTLL